MLLTTLTSVAGPITNVQFTTATTGGSTTSVAATFSGTPVTGNLLIAALSFSNQAGIAILTPPTGWTAIAPQSNYMKVGLALFYRWAQVGDSLTWTFTSNNTDYLALGLTEWQGTAGFGVPQISLPSNATGTSITTSSTVSYGPSFPVAFFTEDNGHSATANGGGTLLFSALPTFHGLACVTGSQTASGTTLGVTWSSSTDAAIGLMVYIPLPSTLFLADQPATGIDSNTTSLSITINTQPLTNSLLLALISYSASGGETITAPAGWTQLVNGNFNNAANAVFYRFAQAGDGLTWTWTVSASDYASGGILNFCNAGTPSAVLGTGNTSSTPTMGVTAIPAKAWSLPLVLFAANSAPTLSSTGTNTQNLWVLRPSFHGATAEMGLVTSQGVSYGLTWNSSSDYMPSTSFVAPWNASSLLVVTVTCNLTANAKGTVGVNGAATSITSTNMGATVAGKVKATSALTAIPKAVVAFAVTKTSTLSANAKASFSKIVSVVCNLTAKTTTSIAAKITKNSVLTPTVLGQVAAKEKATSTLTAKIKGTVSFTKQITSTLTAKLSAVSVSLLEKATSNLSAMASTSGTSIINYLSTQAFSVYSQVINSIVTLIGRVD